MISICLYIGIFLRLIYVQNHIKNRPIIKSDLAETGYVFPDCPAAGSTAANLVSENCEGNLLNLAPKVTFAFGAQFTHPLGRLGDLFVRGDYNHRNQVFFEPQNDARLSGGARELIDLRLGLNNDGRELTGWIKNLTDELYVNFADDRSAIGILTTQAFGAPRTYGVTAKYKF